MKIHGGTWSYREWVRQGDCYVVTRFSTRRHRSPTRTERRLPVTDEILRLPVTWSQVVSRRLPAGNGADNVCGLHRRVTDGEGMRETSTGGKVGPPGKRE